MRPRIEITQEAGAVKRILVGVDGSAASRDALRWAARLAHAADSEVTAVHAFTPETSELSPDYAEVLRSAAERRVEGWCAAAAVGPGSVDWLVIDGGPDALLATAAEQADLLVVGTRGPGSFAHLHLGSVAHHLAHHTLVPLAIVPSQRRRPPGEADRRRGRRLRRERRGGGVLCQARPAVDRHRGGRLRR